MEPFYSGGAAPNSSTSECPGTLFDAGTGRPRQSLPEAPRHGRVRYYVHPTRLFRPARAAALLRQHCWLRRGRCPAGGRRGCWQHEQSSSTSSSSAGDSGGPDAAHGLELVERFPRRYQRGGHHERDRRARGHRAPRGGLCLRQPGRVSALHGCCALLRAKRLPLTPRCSLLPTVLQLLDGALPRQHHGRAHRRHKLPG